MINLINLELWFKFLLNAGNNTFSWIPVIAQERSVVALLIVVIQSVQIIGQNKNILGTTIEDERTLQ